MSIVKSLGVHFFKGDNNIFRLLTILVCTGELGYDRLNGTRKIGPSYAKSVVYI